MKLPIIVCLAVFAAVCYATTHKVSNKEAVDLLKRLLEQRSEAKGLQKKTHEFRNVKVVESMKLISKLRKMKADKARVLAHKHIDAHCDNAYVEFEDESGYVEEGYILYPKEPSSLLSSEKRSKRDDGCTFHITTDDDHEIFFYILKWHSGDDDLTCENGVGQLTMFAGDSDQGEQIGHACGDFEYAFVLSDVHEVFITFTPDDEHDVEFFIFYEIISKAQILESVDNEEHSDEDGGDHGTHDDGHHSQEAGSSGHHATHDDDHHSQEAGSSGHHATHDDDHHSQEAGSSGHHATHDDDHHTQNDENNGHSGVHDSDHSTDESASDIDTEDTHENHKHHKRDHSHNTHDEDGHRKREHHKRGSRHRN